MSVCPYSTEELCNRLVVLAETLAEIKLYPYQVPIIKRIYTSILENEGARLSGCWSRQSGKSTSIACMCASGMVILPQLAKDFPDDPRFNRKYGDKYSGFNKGFWIGVYAPKQDQSNILYNKIRSVFSTDTAKQVFDEAGLMFDTSNGNTCKLSNGAFVMSRSASEGSKVEGHSFHLGVIDECLEGSTLVTTSDGEKTIQSLVDSNYTGKVRGFALGKFCWADVKKHWKIPVQQKFGYNIIFGNGRSVLCTSDHLWFVQGMGYVSTEFLFACYNLEYRLPGTVFVELDGLANTVVRVSPGLPSNETIKTACQYMNQKFIACFKNVEFLQIHSDTLQVTPVGISEIKENTLPEFVYDLTTESGNFFANGILCHNSQDVGDVKLRQGIYPTLAANNGSSVLIGTPGIRKREFFRTIRANKALASVGGNKNHYEYDYTICGLYNPQYLKFVGNEKKLLGEFSDDFRRSYLLHWLTERGMFISDDALEAAGLKEEDWRLFADLHKYDMRHSRIFGSRQGVPCVAGIDLGKTHDSTVVTVMEVDFQHPVEQSIGLTTESTVFYYAYKKHILSWLELFGDDYEIQLPKIVEFLKSYSIVKVCIDATKESHIAERLAGFLTDVIVEPIIFSSVWKSEACKMMHGDLVSRRLTYPAASECEKSQEWRRFKLQMASMEKDYVGENMVVSHPDEPDAHDDFGMSCALCIFAAKEDVSGVTEFSKENIFMQR